MNVIFIITGILIASFSPLNSLPAEPTQPSSKGSAVLKNSTVPQNVTNAPADPPAISSPSKLNDTSPSPAPAPQKNHTATRGSPPTPEQPKNRTATTGIPPTPASAVQSPTSTNQTTSSNGTDFAPRDVVDPEVIVFKNSTGSVNPPGVNESPGIAISKNFTLTKTIGTTPAPTTTTTTTAPPPTTATPYAFFNSPAYGFRSEPELSGRSNDRSPPPSNQPPLEKQSPSRPSNYQPQPERKPAITQPSNQPVPQKQQYYAPTQTAATNNPTTGYYPPPSNYQPAPENYPPPPPAYYPPTEYYPPPPPAYYAPPEYYPMPLNYQPTPQGYSAPVPVPVYYVQPVAYSPQSPPNYQATPQYYPAPQPAYNPTPVYYSPQSYYQQQPQSYPVPTVATAPAYYSQSESSVPPSPQGSQSLPDNDERPENTPIPTQKNYQPTPEYYPPTPEYSPPQQSYQPAPENYPPPPPAYYPTPEYSPPQQNYQPAPEYYPPPPPPPAVYYPAPEYNAPQPSYQPAPEYYNSPPPPVYYTQSESATPQPAPQETAESYKQPEYYPPQPSYQPTPEYYSPPPPPPAYYPAEQSYQPAPQYYSPPPPPPPVYSPPSEYYSPPPPPYSPPPPPVYYGPPPSTYREPPPPPPVDDAIHYLELNESVVCGIFPAVNSELYQNAFDPQAYARSYSKYGTALVTKNDVVPFGACPWRVLITDEYNNLICQGTIVHNRQILTLASCVNGEYPLEKLRVRYGDWDLLNNVNEYEAYKNYESRICRILPVACPSYDYGYSSSAGELVLLQVDLVEDYDKYPHIKPVCLPKWPYNPPPPPPPQYYAPPPPYPARVPYSAPPPLFSAPPPSYSVPHSVPPYNPRSYAPVYSEPMYSECWVAGWYGSPITELKNHEPPKGSSYASQNYNPYNSSHYPEQSLIPRKAKVKRVPSYSQSYSYGKCQDEEQQWVGVDGYDACVGDKGASIICLVDDHKSCKSSRPYSMDSPYSEDHYEYHHEIQAKAAQAKNRRMRAVVVAIVKEVSPCTVYEGKDYSHGGYRQQTSKPIVAVRVSSEDVDFIVDKFWEGALDYSCPALPSPFRGPAFYPESRAHYSAPKPPYGPYSRPPQYYSAPAPVPSYNAPPSYYTVPAPMNSENGMPPRNVNPSPRTVPSSPGYAYSSPPPPYSGSPPGYNYSPPPSPEYYAAPTPYSPPGYKPERLRRASSFVMKVIP